MMMARKTASASSWKREQCGCRGASTAGKRAHCWLCSLGRLQGPACMPEPSSTPQGCSMELGHHLLPCVAPVLSAARGAQGQLPTPGSTAAASTGRHSSASLSIWFNQTLPCRCLGCCRLCLGELPGPSCSMSQLLGVPANLLLQQGTFPPHSYL